MQSFWQDLNTSFDPLQEKLQAWLNEAIRMIPNLLLAALVLVIGIFLSRLFKKYFLKLMGRVSRSEAVNNLVANIATVVFMFFVIFIVLGILELDTTLRSMLAGAGVVGLAIGLALQDPLLNLFSGIMLSTRNFFHIGDLVKTNDYFGTVRRISLRNTYLRTLQGQEVVIPNRLVIQSPFTNYSSLNERRVDISCGVSYGDDLKKAAQVAREAVSAAVEYDKQRDVELFYNEFGNSSINFTLRFWLPTTGQKDYLKAQSEAIMAIKEAFDKHDITIPFPIRTLDFGIKGGETLATMLDGHDGNIGSAADAGNSH